MKLSKMEAIFVLGLALVGLWTVGKLAVEALAWVHGATSTKAEYYQGRSY